MPDDFERTGELKPKQRSVLGGFLRQCIEESNTEPRFTAYYDEASAFFNDMLAERFGLELSTTEEFYDFMAGLSLGTVWVEHLVHDSHHGYTVDTAVWLMVTSMARLAPVGATLGDEAAGAVQPVGYYDQTSAFVRDSLRQGFGLDIDQPAVFDRAMAGMRLGTEWLEGLVREGLTISEAGDVARISLARLYESIGDYHDLLN